MKSVLISIRPKWCEKIASGDCNILVKKSAPKEVPFKCYIYMTQGTYKDLGLYSESIYQNRMKVIGEFICDKVSTYPRNYEFGYGISENEFNETALTAEQFVGYGNGGMLYGWHISDLKIYDKPKELSEFRKPLDRVWGSYCNDYCDRGCISFGSTDYSCNDYWNWEKGLTRPPQSYMFVEEVEQ